MNDLTSNWVFTTWNPGREFLSILYSIFFFIYIFSVFLLEQSHLSNKKWKKKRKNERNERKKKHEIYNFQLLHFSSLLAQDAKKVMFHSSRVQQQSYSDIEHTLQTNPSLRFSSLINKIRLSSISVIKPKLNLTLFCQKFFIFCCRQLVDFNGISTSVSYLLRNPPYIYILLWTPSYGRTKAGRPARTYIQQLCEDTGCSPEDLPKAMNNREEWRERVWDIRAGGTTWWWWMYI